MTFYDACKEIENISFVDPEIINSSRSQSLKDRKQTLAALTILELAQKGELFSKAYVDQVLWERDIAMDRKKTRIL